MSETAAADIPKPLAVAVVAGVTSIQVIATMAMILPPSIAPKLAAALGIPVELIGLQVSVAYCGAMAMSVVAGVVQRRFGAVRTNQMAAALVVLSLLLLTVPTLPAFAAGSLGVGLAYGMINPAASHLMMKVASPANRNLIFSLKQTGQPLGGVVAGLMGPPLAVAFGWQWSLVAGAVIAAIAGLAIQPLRRRFDTDREPHSRFRGALLADIQIVWRNRGLRLLGFAAFCFAAVQLALVTYAVTMLVEEISLDLVTAGAILAGVQIAGVCGRLVWGAVADRLRNGLRTILIVQALSLVAAVLTALMGPDDPMWRINLILLLFGFTAIGWNGVFMAEIARLAPAGRIGSATGGVLVVTFLGVMFGPVIFTAAHDAVGAYTSSYGVTTLLIVAGMAFIWRLGRRQPERP